MPLIDKLYEWITLIPATDVDRALGEALEFAEPEWARRIEQVLVKRANDASWAALASRYDSLSDDVRQRILEPVDIVENGIGLALRGDGVPGRLNALRAIEDHGDPRMAFHLTDALRDQSASVRGSAANTLRRLAEKCASSDPRRDTAADRERYRDQRRRVVDTLEQALRIFHIHHRVEVIEAALWFARDLEEILWRRIESPRSPFAKVIKDHLTVWDGPRLAGYHITSLSRPGWAGESLQLLRQWSTLDHLLALLRESSALNDPTVRQRLTAVREPRWFAAAGAELDLVPAELRRHAPRWVRSIGFDDGKREALLSRWLESQDERLSVGAACALADMGTPTALATLRKSIHCQRPSGRFARWFVLGCDHKLAGLALRKVRMPDDVDDEAAHIDFVLLWRACRRAAANERSPLIQLIREHADVWRTRLAAHLQSPDPRDRLLALQIVSTMDLTTRFHRELQPLREDPVEGLRKLASAVLSSVSVAARSGHSAPPSRPPAAAANDQRRIELHGVLEKLNAGELDIREPQIAEDLRRRLREIYGGGHRGGH